MVEKDPVRREFGATEFGAREYHDRPADLVAESDLVVLAVKPQDVERACDALRTDDGSIPLIVSVLAGTTIERLTSLLGTARIVRVMPNLAADIGRAVVGVCYSAATTHEDRETCRSLLDAMGTILEVREELIAAITGLSGSGIAFAFEFIHALALGGVAEGLTYADALRGAREVVGSAADLLIESGAHPQEMVSRVASPAGTTIAGLAAMYRGAFTATVIEAVSNAADRSRQLER
jgi:pyrroline-5-carboxylate reductase